MVFSFFKKSPKIINPTKVKVTDFTSKSLNFLEKEWYKIYSSEKCTEKGLDIGKKFFQLKNDDGELIFIKETWIKKIK